MGDLARRVEKLERRFGTQRPRLVVIIHATDPREPNIVLDAWQSLSEEEPERLRWEGKTRPEAGGRSDRASQTADAASSTEPERGDSPDQEPSATRPDSWGGAMSAATELEELVSREWRHVDFKAGWLRLEPGETKNDEGRMFPLIPALRVILEIQQAPREALQRQSGRIVPWVFFRPNRQPIGDFKRTWTTARRKAGIPGRLLHDFRRTAVRGLVRAGLAESVAMKMTGHKTNAIFKRYAIVDESLLREGGEKLAASLAAPSSKETLTRP
jgi:hypothetical protein